MPFLIFFIIVNYPNCFMCLKLSSVRFLEFPWLEMGVKNCHVDFLVCLLVFVFET